MQLLVRLPRGGLVLDRHLLPLADPDGQKPEVRHIERDVFRERSPDRVADVVARHDARCRALYHRDRRRGAEREVLADVYRAVPCADDDGVLSREQRPAGEAGGMHDAPLEAFYARYIRNDWARERARGEDEVGWSEFDLDAIADDGDVPALVLGVVRRARLEL